MCLIPVRKFALACTLIFVSLTARSQNVSRQSIEIDGLGKTTSNLQTCPCSYSGVSYVELIQTRHPQVFGGGLAAYRYALSPGLALEARGGFLFGHQPTVTQSGGEETLFHMGLRAGLPLGHSRFAFSALVAPGFSSFSSVNRSGKLTITPIPGVPGGFVINIDPEYGRVTHFSLEEGVGLSARLTRRSEIHFDLTHEFLVEGDRRQGALGYPGSVEDHGLIAIGVSRSFGKVFSSPEPLWRSDSAIPPSNELVVSMDIQPQVHLENRDLSTDLGVGITGSHFLRSWIALDSSILVLPGGDTANYQDGGTEAQFFAGIKIGIRRDRYGVFAKLRPGLATFNNTYNDARVYPPPSAIADDAVVDGGAVIEFYPHRNLVMRLDLGQVMTHYSSVDLKFSGNTAHQPGMSWGSAQILIGTGWRF